MQTPDEDGNIAKMTYVRGLTNENFSTPIEKDEELMVVGDEGTMWVISKNGSRFVHLCRLSKGDKVIIEVV